VDPPLLLLLCLSDAATAPHAAVDELGRPGVVPPKGEGWPQEVGEGCRPPNLGGRDLRRRGRGRPPEEGEAHHPPDLGGRKGRREVEAGGRERACGGRRGRGSRA
jgi:hypothetical protein